MRRVGVALALLAALLLPTAAGGGGGGGGGYVSDLERGSSADAYLAHATSCLSGGAFPGRVEATAIARTSSSPSKSSYLRHNVQLHLVHLGRPPVFLARSPDTTRRVAGPSDTNYLSSLQNARVTETISCTHLMVPGMNWGGVRAGTYHKGIAIPEEGGISHVFDEEDVDGFYF